jgi:hypothetical protein
MKNGKSNKTRINSQRKAKIFYRNLGMKNTQFREPISVAEVEPYWKSFWGERSTAN